MNLRDMLERYSNLQTDIRVSENRIHKYEKILKRLDSEGLVKDTVSGGEGGIQHFVIEGIPIPAYSNAKSMIQMNTLKRDRLINESFEMMLKVDEAIMNISDIRIRNILSLRYLENKSWLEVANERGGENTEDGVRMLAVRYLEKIGENL